MDNTFSGIPTKTVVNDSVERFTPDYKYLSKEDLRAVTRNQLAKLESDLHSLRVVLVANGHNPNVFIAPQKTVGSEIGRVEAVIAKLEEYFSEVLNEDNLGQPL